MFALDSKERGVFEVQCEFWVRESRFSDREVPVLGGGDQVAFGGDQGVEDPILVALEGVDFCSFPEGKGRNRVIFRRSDEEFVSVERGDCPDEVKKSRNPPKKGETLGVDETNTDFEAREESPTVSAEPKGEDCFRKRALANQSVRKNREGDQIARPPSCEEPAFLGIASQSPEPDIGFGDLLTFLVAEPVPDPNRSVAA